MSYSVDDHFAEKMDSFFERVSSGQDVSALAASYLQRLRDGDWKGMTRAARKNAIETLRAYVRNIP